MKLLDFVNIVFKRTTLILILFSGIVLADTRWDTAAYNNNKDHSQILSIVNATSLKVSVFGNTKDHDYLYIEDKDGNQLKKFHGNNINETFEVTGDSIRARLISSHPTVHSKVVVEIKDHSSYNNRANSMLIRFTNTKQNNVNNAIVSNDINTINGSPIRFASNPGWMDNIYQLEQDINQLLNTKDPIKLTFVEHNTPLNTTLINLSQSVNHDIIYQLILKDYVEYSEPNGLLIPHNTEFLPNDPLYPKQWSLKSKGINLPKAQEHLGIIGNDTIVVAVLDVGFTKNEDLLGNMLKKFDKKTNRYSTTEVYGYDFFDNDSNPFVTTTPIPMHGTAVASIIAALTNNKIGMAGVNGIDGRVKILPIRIVKESKLTNQQDEGKGGVYTAFKAMRWAAGIHIDGIPDNKYSANIINISAGIEGVFCQNPYSDSSTSTLNTIIQELNALGVTIVVSAGNRDDLASNSVPASCKDAITVGAIDLEQNRSIWNAGKASNYGGAVDVSAPGSKIIALGNNNHTYFESGGTSFAAPHVSGIISLMLLKKPDLTPAEIKKIIRKSVNDFPISSSCTSDPLKEKPGKKGIKYCGTGTVDAYQAIVNTKAMESAINSATELTLNAPVPLQSNTMYKFKRTTDSELEYYINYEHISGELGSIDFYVGINDVPSANSYDCKMNFTYNKDDPTLVTIMDTGMYGPKCAIKIKLKKHHSLYILAKSRQHNGEFDLQGSIGIGSLSKFQVRNMEAARLKHMEKMSGKAETGGTSMLASWLASIGISKKKRDTDHIRPLGTKIIKLNQTSMNYSKKTPSGDSSVYFVVPMQPNIIYSDSDRVQQSLWSGIPGASKVIALAVNKSGDERQVVLRMQKKFRNKWLKMNDGMQRGYGQVKISFHPKDNLNLIPDNYTTKFAIVAVGWHDQDYRAFIEAKLNFTMPQ